MLVVTPWALAAAVRAAPRRGHPLVRARRSIHLRLAARLRDTPVGANVRPAVARERSGPPRTRRLTFLAWRRPPSTLCEIYLVPLFRGGNGETLAVGDAEKKRRKLLWRLIFFLLLAPVWWVAEEGFPC